MFNLEEIDLDEINNSRAYTIDNGEVYAHPAWDEDPDEPLFQEPAAQNGPGGDGSGGDETAE